MSDGEEFQVEGVFEDDELNNKDEQPNDDATTANSSNSTKRKVAVKNVVTKKRVTLSAERLCGERGIPILPQTFANVKFKGKHHVKDDLDTLMKVYEHWGYRLFPKLPFDDILDRIERLGSKRPVKTCLRRIRLDMPILEMDFVSHDGAAEDSVHNDEQIATKDSFDALIGYPLLPSSSASSSLSNTLPMATADIDDMQVLTDELLEKIKKNRQMALEKQAARLKLAEERPSTSGISINGSSELATNDEAGITDQMFPPSQTNALPHADKDELLATDEEMPLDTIPRSDQMCVKTSLGNDTNGDLYSQEALLDILEDELGEL